MLASRCSAVTLGVSAGGYLRMSFTLTTRVSGIGLSEQSSHPPFTPPLALAAVTSPFGPPGTRADMTGPQRPFFSTAPRAFVRRVIIFVSSDRGRLGNGLVM